VYDREGVMPRQIDRREFIQGLGAVTAGLYAWPVHNLLAATSGRKLPTAPVAVAKCAQYGPGVRDTLATLFDQLRGLPPRVGGTTVAVKLNMSGGDKGSLRGLPKGATSGVHPDVIGATISLFSAAGARRIRLLESSLSPSTSLERFMERGGWNPRVFSSAGT